jgi:chitinase
VFPGTGLADCSFLSADIETCQSKDKIVTLSLGGATGSVGFASAEQAEEFAGTVWDLFLGGESDTRPFGDAVLDGVDLDIEGGTGEYYVDFVNKIQSLGSGADKKYVYFHQSVDICLCDENRYYITAAPQCVFPDAALGNVLNGAAFDAIYGTIPSLSLFL